MLYLVYYNSLFRGSGRVSTYLVEAKSGKLAKKFVKAFLKRTGEPPEEYNDKHGETMLKAIPQKGLSRWELPNPDARVLVLGDSNFYDDKPGEVYGTMVELPGKVKLEE